MLGAILGAAASIGGSLLGKSQADKNAKLQKQFAQEGIQWKVEDAKKAGIHPLYALGAQTHSFTPSAVGDWTAGIGQAGQDIGRAIDATQTHDQRATSTAKQYATLQLQNMSLQNDLLAARIATIRQAGHPPAAPGSPTLIDGQGDTAGMVNTTPLKVQSANAAHPSQEAGTVSEVGYLRTPTGYQPVKSKDAQERLEDDHLGSFMHSFRNHVYGNNPPNIPVPEGYDAWVYNPLTFQYEAMRFPKWMGKYGRYFAY